jgi:rod shape determining protein RodA
MFMFNKIFLYLKNFDWILFVAVLFLVSFGLVEIYSIALGQNVVDLLNFKKQIIFVITGLAALFAFAFFDYQNLRSFGNYIYIIGFALLLGVLLFGETIRGTRGWFYFGNYSIQPVEFVKIILIIYLARYFSSIAIKLSPIKHLLISGLGSVVFVVLVLMQPDFGSALILFFVWTMMLLVAGFNKKYFLIISLILIIIAASGWLFFFKDYQKQRVITFINPASDPLDEGYNISQAIIAIGAGRFIGRGIGFGSQSQLKFLPESQNDFIFAVISEELGFLGASLVLFFFGIIFYRLFVSIKKINNDFSIFLIIGILSLIFVEMFINIGMNIGLLPVIGISLPFVSYGGSAILSSLILIGIAENIIIKSKISY